MDVARALGASFEPGPSGMSIRAQTPAHRQPVTVAWIFAPGKPGWMKTRDISLGHGLDYPTTDPVLHATLEAYYEALVEAGIGTEASAKGVHARSITPDAAYLSLEELSGRLVHIIKALAALPARRQPPMPRWEPGRQLFRSSGLALPPTDPSRHSPSGGRRGLRSRGCT